MDVDSIRERGEISSELDGLMGPRRDGDDRLIDELDEAGDEMSQVKEVMSPEFLFEEKDTQEYRPFWDPASISLHGTC